MVALVYLELPKQVHIALLKRNMLCSAVRVSLSNTAMGFIELPAESSNLANILRKKIIQDFFYPLALCIDL